MDDCNSIIHWSTQFVAWQFNELQKCSTHGYIMWTFFKGVACLNLQGCNVTLVSSDEPWILFLCFFLSWSSQTTCLNDFFMLPKRSNLCSPSLHPLLRHNNLMYLCIGLLPLLSFSFLLEEKSCHCLVLMTLFLLIIVEEHHCKMYKKRVVVHYSLLYHPKSIFHNHKYQSV